MTTALLKIAEVCELLCVSKWTLAGWVWLGAAEEFLFKPQVIE